MYSYLTTVESDVNLDGIKISVRLYVFSAPICLIPSPAAEVIFKWNIDSRNSYPAL